MKSHRGIHLFMFISIAVTIVSFVIWLNTQQFGGNLPCEPRIKEQIKLQSAAIKSGNDIPLPIPIRLGDDTIYLFDQATLGTFFLKHGWTELPPTSANVFGNAANKVLINGSGNYSVSIGSQNLGGFQIYSTRFGPDIYSTNSSNMMQTASTLRSKPLSEKGSLPAVFGLPSLGSNLTDIKKYLKDVDYRFDDTYQNGTGFLQIRRGVYLYCFVYFDNVLESISIDCSRELYDDAYSNRSKAGFDRLMHNGFRGHFLKLDLQMAIKKYRNRFQLLFH